MDRGAWWAAVHGVARSQTRLSDFAFTFHFHALEKEMATHSSVLAWRIPGMGEPGGLPSMGSHRVGHDWSDLAAAAPATFTIILLINNLLISEIQTHLFFFFYEKGLRYEHICIHTHNKHIYLQTYTKSIHVYMCVCVYIHTCTYEYLKFILEYLFKYQNNFTFIILLGFNI